MRTLILFLAVIFYFVSSNIPAAEWYRGNTHAHSWWSDGNVPPEDAVNWYKTHDYHFLVLSDHTNLQTDKDRWRDATDTVIDRLKSDFGQDWVETREIDGKKQLRLKTIHELKSKFDVPDKFLLIPGHEQNSSVVGRTLHTIAMNVTETVPFQSGATLEDSILNNLAAIDKTGRDAGTQSLMIINHPSWPFYDVGPDALINADAVQFFEHISDFWVRDKYKARDDIFWSREQYWDIINAFRTIRGKSLLYGVGADDTHDYLDFSPKRIIPGKEFIVVRAERLTADAIVKSMKKGDFYLSTGVLLQDVRFDSTTKTLTVEVKPVDGIRYRIDFIGTKKNFDQNVKSFTLEQGANNPAREGISYKLDDFGVVLKTEHGTKAEYRQAEDDLYVRAIITSTKAVEYPSGHEPNTESAWTQPY